MEELNFPKYQFKVKAEGGRTQIFDVVRKKYVVLTPEEWVRQHAIHFLNIELGYPISLMKVERQLLLNHRQRRFDLVCYNATGAIILLAEFKQPQVCITQATFNQIAQYNFVLRTPFLWVSNGIGHYMAQINFSSEEIEFVTEIPHFSDQ